jgi:hypothetical protein
MNDVQPADETCPACDAAALGEWDPVLRLFHCPTCSATWRQGPRPGRMVPRQTSRLPFNAPRLALDSEWPADSELTARHGRSVRREH